MLVIDTSFPCSSIRISGDARDTSVTLPVLYPIKIDDSAKMKSSALQPSSVNISSFLYRNSESGRDAITFDPPINKLSPGFTKDEFILALYVFNWIVLRD